ncbi:MAG: hypothetical protein A2857_00810 [Candidatus Levybacteria bacterium RIFCSPHIGHO2_01_FULL_36_15]|nr:MAG: hypothetical protein A2857_00810 [Candidatus Levybacteria bacterium RIFCSPHIGHO2_01_FULL_36_15]OGH37283.1 MAG: hypothetical protein A2905_01100 [Candidatus Levybacteria bacterium RIFCSPLOWO2_01_FULL_36_10]
MDQNLTCPYCKFNITPNIYFCPNCGKKLKDKPLSTSTLKQTGVYLVSLLIPPSGLWYGYKYLKQGDYKSKIIGIIAVVITLVSLIFTVKLTVDVINSVNQSLNKYQSLGF